MESIRRVKYQSTTKCDEKYVSHLQSTISQRVVEQCSVAGGFAFRHVFSFNSASE